jgi:phosphoribosylformylglycinamidine synthase I
MNRRLLYVQHGKEGYSEKLKKHKIRVCILRTSGTNCDRETKRAFEEVGVQADVRRSTQISSQALDKYHVLVFPGGFSYGDYVRAGAIWSREIKVRFGRALQQFVADGKPILGICNGFQVLVELGLLPAIRGISEYPEMALATNTSAHYECRWVAKDEFLYLKHENRGNCVFTKDITPKRLLQIPIAHTEGRILFPEREKSTIMQELINNDQLVFRFVDSSGTYPRGRYPTNPNGSMYDITGLCNPQGNVLGLMPHPERAIYSWQLPEVSLSAKNKGYGDGMLIFTSVIRHMENEF